MPINTDALTENQLEAFDERAGILEHDANMTRSDSEIEAYKQLFGNYEYNNINDKNNI